MTKATDPKSNVPAIGTKVEKASPNSKANQQPAAAAAQASSSPRNWDEIKVGSLVIAHEAADSGWWEAVVIGITDDKLTLRWRDYPEQPSLTRQRRQVALLAPGK